MIVRVVWECLSEEVAFELKNYKNQPCKDLGGESILGQGKSMSKGPVEVGMNFLECGEVPWLVLKIFQ